MKTLIYNGFIVDGNGNQTFRGDILIEDDKIVKVFASEENARDSLGDDVAIFDATNCIVSPGFIDSHAHSDAYLILEPGAPSKISQGITTEINGQCGGSIAPRYGDARLSSDWASLLGSRLNWHSLAEYRDELSKSRPAINTVQFVGHNTLRASVVGYEGRLATRDELAKMSRLLEVAMDEGAWGLTTGLIYQPGKYANRDEVFTLASVASKKGGLYATHMKSEGDFLLESIDEVIELAKETGIRAEISHLKTSGEKNWSKIDDALAKIEVAMKEGFLIGADRYPYCAAGTDLDVVFPDWAGEGAALAECSRLATRDTRDRIIRELNESTRDWSRVMIGGVWHEDNREYSGRTISEILASSPVATSPGELVCEILQKDECRTGAFFFAMSEENLAKILSRDWIVPGSDASLRAPWGPLGKDHPHPRAYGTMPEFYRRVRDLGVSREVAIARMTSIPADRFGICNRGRLIANSFADIVVWSEDEFASTATFANPHAFASGVKAVWVNGVLSYENGRDNGNRGGKFLEKK